MKKGGEYPPILNNNKSMLDIVLIFHHCDVDFSVKIIFTRVIRADERRSDMTQKPVFIVIGSHYVYIRNKV